MVGTIELTSVLILPPSGSFAIHDDDLLKEEIIYFSFEKQAVRFAKKTGKASSEEGISLVHPLQSCSTLALVLW